MRRAKIEEGRDKEVRDEEDKGQGEQKHHSKRREIRESQTNCHEKSLATEVYRRLGTRHWAEGSKPTPITGSGYRAIDHTWGRHRGHRTLMRFCNSILPRG